MSLWTAQRVLDAAAAMEFVPEGAIEVRTDDYRLVRHPDWVLGPTDGAAQVTWSRTARAPDEVIDGRVVRDQVTCAAPTVGPSAQSGCRTSR